MPKNHKHPRLQHFVPQFLLRNFVDEQGQLHVFDKATGRVFTASPRGIAAEAGFYDFTDDAGKPHSAESLLGRLEDLVANVVAGILAKESLAHLSISDRVRLSLFVAVQQIRVKAVRQRMKSLNAGILEVLAQRGIDPGDVIWEMDDEEVTRQSIPRIVDAKPAAKTLFDMAWILYRAPEGKPFYISDNPVVLHNLVAPRQLRLDSPGIEVYLPISPSLALCFMCRHSVELMQSQLQKAAEIKRRHGYCAVDIEPIARIVNAIDTGTPDPLLPDNVDHVNSLQVQYASQFIVSSIDDFELAKLMIGKNPRLKEPPGFIVH